jgi:hypothetical protein
MTDDVMASPDCPCGNMELYPHVSCGLMGAHDSCGALQHAADALPSGR